MGDFEVDDDITHDKLDKIIEQNNRIIELLESIADWKLPHVTDEGEIFVRHG
jgi:hypothetical protein